MKTRVIREVKEEFIPITVTITIESAGELNSVIDDFGRSNIPGTYETYKELKRIKENS